MALREVNDRIVQARCKSVDLAIIARGLFQSGIMVTGTSSLVREAIQWLAYSIIESGEVKRMSTEEARDILAKLGMEKMPTKYQQKKLGGYAGDRLKARMIQTDSDSEWKDKSPEELAEEYKNDPEIQEALDKLKTKSNDFK